MNEDINDLYGAKEKLPNITSLFKKVGDKVVGQVVTDPKAQPVHEFIGGKRGEQMFFQAGKPVKQSNLNLALPYDPIVQWVFDIQTKDGKRYTAWMDKNKLKALKAAIKAGGRLEKGGMIGIEFCEEEDSGTSFPRRLYKVQLKPAKVEAE